AACARAGPALARAGEPGRRTAGDAGHRRGRIGVSSEWKQRREGGGRFALRLLSAIAAFTGRRAARLLLYPIVLYFLLRRPAERRDSAVFLSRARGRPAGLREVARHIHTFAATILDRFYLLSENTRRFDIRVEGLAALHAHLDAGRGVL